MKSHHLPARTFFYVLCIICIVWCVSCATTQDKDKKQAIDAPAKNEQTTARQGTEQAPKSVLDTLRVETTENGCSLIIPTQEQPNYTIFKLTKPERIIVDLLDKAAGQKPEVKEINNAFITSVTATPITEKGKNFLRIELVLKKSVGYAAASMENSVIITLNDSNTKNVSLEEKTKGQQTEHTIFSARKTDRSSKPQSVSGTTSQAFLKDIQYTVDSGGVHKVSIIADKDIQHYKAYLLKKPLRLVIDLPKTNTADIKPVVNIDDEYVGALRSGQNNDDGRIVIDLKGQIPPSYQVAQGQNTIDIILHAKGKTAETQATQKQADAQAGIGHDQQTKTTNDTSPPSTAEQAGESKYRGEKISFDFKDADIKNVLRLIADISGMNIVVGERVTGKITLKLENIAWDEALDIILENNGLGKIESKNIVRIDTAEQIKRINEEKLLAKKSHEQVQETIVKTVDISYAKAGDIASFIKSMNILTPNRGSVTPFELTNKLTINDIPSVVAKVEEIIKEQDIPTRQVMIEARVVQTSPNYVKEMGIRWGGEYQGHQHGGRAQGGADIPISGTLGPDGNSVVDLLTAGNIGIGFGYIKDRYNLDVKLSALENEDKLKILSNPKILTLDNKESEIKQGVALPYLKLNENGVSSTEFKEAVLEMKVRPKITSANTIALNISVKKDQKSAQTGVNNEPGIDVREIKTDLLVASGKTIVIGGIYENTVSTNIKKVPYLADIPFLGRAFRSEKHEDQLTELLVFLTVTIVPSPETVADLTDKKG
ncbi:MAG: type IV pilus secretin PilQ [Desulfobacterota bacterium]|nr:type IV pilus secretin PilQ [Thermodesulfobacteriota bacterium]